MNFQSQSFKRRVRDFPLELAQSTAMGSFLTFLGTGFYKLTEMVSGATPNMPVTIAMGTSFATAAFASASYSLLRLREFEHGDLPNIAGQRVGVSAGILAPIFIAATLHAAIPLKQQAPIIDAPQREKSMTFSQMLCHMIPTPSCEHG